MALGNVSATLTPHNSAAGIIGGVGAVDRTATLRPGHRAGEPPRPPRRRASTLHVPGSYYLETWRFPPLSVLLSRLPLPGV